MKNELKKDAFDLGAELDGIGHNINAIANLIKDHDDIPAHDQLSMASVGEVLFSIQEHIFRISEDWVTYTERLEEQVKVLSQKGGCPA